MERRYSVPPPVNGSLGVESPLHQPVGPRTQPGMSMPTGPSTSEDLHAWSIYRQNLNSDFTDSALGSSEKSPLPYGNFQLRESTVQSILSHPRYGPKSALGANMYTYLKFGLPRVFPPSRGPRDGSSGYDSSDDGSPYLHRQGRSYLRSRSDPDFRNHLYLVHGPRPGPPPGGGRGGRSSSEANLLSQEAHLRHHELRRSVHDLRGVQHGAPPSQVGSRRRVSKAGSHVSLVYGQHGPHREELEVMGARLGPVAEGGIPYYAALSDHMDAGGVFKYPHLQVRGLEVEARSNHRQLLLAGVSFEVYGGEIMAVMATTEEEGTGLLDALSGRSSSIGKLRGDILLNGQLVHSNQLRDRVAYIQSDSQLSADLSVRQTLAFHHWLRRSSRAMDKADTKTKMDSLIEDLGLEQVRHTKVAGLTTSEKRRLNVACHLLLDTDIVVLDQPTRGMDIFDTFFLVEFLRQWAGNGSSGMSIPGVSGGRIVVLTLHPPTYEIFTMLSRVALVSAGRFMFSGRRRDMLPYFATVDYPCPAYKNPSDYYLDLVTLDDLSAEAMLESSQRIEQLADLFRRRQEPLSEPGPPIALPGKVRQASCITQAAILLIRAVVYTQPSSLVSWLTQVLQATLMSVAVGAVFWNVPASDPHLVQADRLGFHATMALVAPWPMLLLALGEVSCERWAVSRDVHDRLYGRFLYIVTKIVYNLPGSLCIWLAFLVPAYLMSGLHIQGSDYSGFSVYVGLMLLYLMAMQMMLTALGHALHSPHLAAILSGLLFTSFAAVSGLQLHMADLASWCRWLRWISPARWILPVLVSHEYRPEAIPAHIVTHMCRKKSVQRQEIIVQVACPTPNGTAALEYAGLLPDPHQPHYMPALATIVFCFICFLLATGSFLACRYRPRQPRNNPNKP